jgi:sigma-B regulation protein RsbU (phosphoserine phosphatase)
MAAPNRGVARWSTALCSSYARHRTTSQDLRSAAAIQHQLLPPPLYTGRYVDLAAKAHPCRIIGGDFFDYQDLGHQFRLALGDVCGNGAPAALQAAVVQGILAIQTDVDGGAAGTMTHLNRALCRRAIPARFVTLFLGIVTPDGGFTYCNAGQCCPILVNRDSVRNLSSGGCPLGLFADATYEEESLALAPGDRLVVFSDGVPETQGRSQNPNEEFGDARVLQTVREHPDANAAAILDHLLAKLRGFARQGKPHDDVAALVMRYLGKDLSR